MELTNIQKQIITTNESHVLVMSAAASGKSAVIVERLRYLLKQGIDPSKIVAITFTNNAASVMYERLGHPDGLFIGTVHSYCNYLLRGNAIDTTKIIQEERFDDLFQEIKENISCLKHIEHLLVDEVQDSTTPQFEFFELLKPDNYMYCGDVRQCQPKGTLITLPDKTEKPIEELKIGDKVLSYNMSAGRIIGGTAKNSKNGIIKNIQKRILNNEEDIIEVTLANGYVTYYTPNHRTIANLCKYDEYNYLTYLMCDKNNRFRVGTSQFRNSSNVPWRSKMRDEGCEKIWILDTFKTNKEARVLEDKISYKYQIPQITFQLNKTTYTQKDIDYIYEGLDTITNAERCLKDFNRDIRFPFGQLNDNIHYAGNAFNQVFACNLLPKNMKLKIFNPNSISNSRTTSVDISSIKYIKNSHMEVYSLEIDPYETYIADKIVTHNSIYGFNGANPDYINQLSKREDVTVYYMRNNFRNAPNILRFAKRFLFKLGDDYFDDSIAMRTPESKKPQVIEKTCTLEEAVELLMSYNESLETNWGDWFVLCRTNKDIENFRFLFKKKGIPTDTFKQADLTNSQIKKKMEENTIKILTVHSAKGLENKCVLSFNIRAYNDEETRLCYVSATRAKDFLFWVKMPKKRKRSRVVSWE